MTTAIVTGASRGIGRETAIQLAEIPSIHNLVLLASNIEKLEETKNLIKDNINVECIQYDLENLNEIGKLVDNIFLKYGEIHYLVNIAGYTDPKSLLEVKIEDLTKTFEINVFSMVELTKHCVKYMKNNDFAKILNVASTAGSTPRPGWVSYASSKAAVISISRTLSQELAPYNIKVYCVSPGRTATDLRKKLAPDEDPTTIMQPVEVANVIKMLLESDKDCLDGQDIIIRR